jgi:ribose-phosphate pyrophosphokinase
MEKRCERRPATHPVAALPDDAALGAALARSLRCDCTVLALHRFPDGEALVRLDARSKTAAWCWPPACASPTTSDPAAAVCRRRRARAGRAQVGLVAPYLAYMRQDKRFRPGEAVTSRSYARLLSGHFDWLVTVDPHLHRWHSLDEIYTVPAEVVAAAPQSPAGWRGTLRARCWWGPTARARSGCRRWRGCAARPGP